MGGVHANSLYQQIGVFVLRYTLGLFLEMLYSGIEFCLHNLKKKIIYVCDPGPQNQS